MKDIVKTLLILKIKGTISQCVLCNFFYFQNGISKLITTKLQTIARFKGIKQMWVGADYSVENKWQWRGYYKAFTGE
jgi:hypothetical protein